MIDLKKLFPSAYGDDSEKNSQGIGERLNSALKSADKKTFIMASSLLGGVTLGGIAYNNYKTVQQQVNEMVIAGKIDAMTADVMLGDSRRKILGQSILGAALGAGAGLLVYNRFMGKKDDKSKDS